MQENSNENKDSDYTSDVPESGRVKVNETSRDSSISELSETPPTEVYDLPDADPHITVMDNTKQPGDDDVLEVAEPGDNKLVIASNPDMQKSENKESKDEDIHAHEQTDHKYKNDTHIKMNKYQQRAMSSRRVRNKSELDYLFDVINVEAENLNLTPPASAKKIITTYDYPQKDEASFNSEYTNTSKRKKLNATNMQDKTNSPQKRPRGRPLSISPELASSEYDENGIKIDLTYGGIDFDDSLFKMIGLDNKKVYTCPDASCNKIFPSLSRAKRHYIVHTGHRPFKCNNPLCNKYFSRKDNMLQHEKMHCSAVKRHKKE